MALSRLAFLKLSLLCVSLYVASGKHPYPEEVVKLSLVVSRASYIPINTKRFVQHGQIIENPSTSTIRKLLGIIPLPPKYDPSQDRRACTLGGWIGKGYENEETEAVMFKNDRQKLVIFAFRGTEPENFVDWSSNLNFREKTTTLGEKKFVTHAGFMYRYGVIAPWFEKEYQAVPRDYSIILTGHSLGAAEATIAAVYAAAKLKRRPDVVVTFGLPKLGKTSFQQIYEETVGCDRTLNLATKNDPVTYLPLNFMHACNKVKVTYESLNGIKAHNLYAGYAKVLNIHFRNADKSDYGCDTVLN